MVASSSRKHNLKSYVQCFHIFQLARVTRKLTATSNVFTLFPQIFRTEWNLGFYQSFRTTHLVASVVQCAWKVKRWCYKCFVEDRYKLGNLITYLLFRGIMTQIHVHRNGKNNLLEKGETRQ